MPREEFVTNDLSFAAYLTMHGISPVHARKMGNTYKFTFEASSEIEKLRYTFPGSESSRFDDAVRKMKKLVFGDR